MSGWIKRGEYQMIKDDIKHGTSVKAAAYTYNRAIGTIYNIKNTEDHRSYCKAYNQRQYRAEYVEDTDALVGNIEKWLEKKTYLLPEYPLDEPDWEDKLMDRLDTIEDDIAEIKRMLNAIDYMVKR